MAAGLMTTSQAIASPGSDAQNTLQNGNFAITISQGFLDEQQHLMKKAFIVETRDIKLKDVRVQQKTDQVRLTSIMGDMQLASINLDDSNFHLDFTTDKELTDETVCE